MNGLPILTLLTLLPLIGGLIVFIVGRQFPKAVRPLSIGFSLLTLGFSILLIQAYDPADPEPQFVERANWIPQLGAEYHTGVDGLSITLVLLSTLVGFMAILASRTVTQRPHLYYALMLFTVSGLLGAFTALNFFHWFMFWELTLVPAFFLIRLWGGPEAASASVKFFVYSMAGSICLLLGMVAIQIATGTLDFARLAEMGRSGELDSALAAKLKLYSLSSAGVSGLVFAGILIGLAVKVPLMPLHSWLADTYTEAPAPVTMLLTGALSKMGVYGFLRILLPLFPERIRVWGGALLALACLSAIISAAISMSQNRIRRVLAFSSINHLAFCLLGAFALASSSKGTALFQGARAFAVQGIILQMFNHGITAAGLFWLAGILENRSGKFLATDFGCLGKTAPLFAFFFGVLGFSSLGLPGLNGFPGEFLIFKGTFSFSPWAASITTLALLFTALAYTRLFRVMLFGPVPEGGGLALQISRSERLGLGMVVALCLLLGVYPRLITDLSNATVLEWVKGMTL